MIRILQVMGGLNRGGAETMVMNLYKSLDRKEIQFDFITHSKTRDDYFDEIKKMGGKIYVFPKFKGYNLISYRKTWKDFFNLHPEYKLLHSHLRSFASIYLPIAKKHGLKTIIHSHSTSNGKGAKSIIKKVLQLPLSRQADYLFSCSMEAGKWLFGDEAICKDNFYIVNNSIDVNNYRYNEKIRNRYRKILNIENKIVYGHIGRLSEPKNHMFLLDIFKKIYEINKDSVLVLVGEGDYREKIETKIFESNLSKNVIMLGSRNDVSRILQAVDVFLFPSLWEGLPVSVVEAQAAGLPCLVSNRVTREVALSPCIKYLPIDKGVDIWVKEALSTYGDRNEDYSDLIIKSGYDIKSTSKWISSFYEKILDK